MAEPVTVRRPPPLTGTEWQDIQELWKWCDYVVRFSKKLTQPVTVTAAYTVAAEVYEVRCNGTLTVTLPPAGTTGRPALIKNIGTGTVTVDGSGSETIDGAATKALSVQYSGIALIDNGSNWDIAFFYSPRIFDISGLAVTDGNFIVGDGTTWVVESGNTARTSLGVGTGDSPQFTAVNVGHASDTTLARVSAGVLSVEGNTIYHAGGTDVALADGGTGASLSDPNADRILFWDDSAGAVTWLTAGTGLTITDTTITASSSGLTEGTPVATNTGATSYDVTSIPSGTKLIIVNFNANSWNASATLILQIGDSGGVETTGYDSACSAGTTSSSSTAGLIITPGNIGATDNIRGTAILCREDSSDNTWNCVSLIRVSPNNLVNVGSGNKALSAELDRVRFTTTAGTATGDAGEFNISYL